MNVFYMAAKIAMWLQSLLRENAACFSFSVCSWILCLAWYASCAWCQQIQKWFVWCLSNRAPNMVPCVWPIQKVDLHLLHRYFHAIFCVSEERVRHPHNSSQQIWGSEEQISVVRLKPGCTQSTQPCLNLAAVQKLSLELAEGCTNPPWL